MDVAEESARRSADDRVRALVAEVEQTKAALAKQSDAGVALSAQLDQAKAAGVVLQQQLKEARDNAGTAQVCVRGRGAAVFGGCHGFLGVAVVASSSSVCDGRITMVDPWVDVAEQGAGVQA